MEEIPLYYSLIIFHKFLYICNFQSVACIQITWGSDPWRFFSTQIRLRNLNRYQATLIQRASYHTLRNSSHTCAFCLSLPGIKLHIVNKKGLTVIRLDVCALILKVAKAFWMWKWVFVSLNSSQLMVQSPLHLAVMLCHIHSFSTPCPLICFTIRFYSFIHSTLFFFTKHPVCWGAGWNTRDISEQKRRKPLPLLADLDILARGRPIIKQPNIVNDIVDKS